jgi:glycosyltransferase involved in cell wall biosynthesis
MRILYCNKYNFAFSGTETYLFEVMDLMRAHGHEVALFAMADPRGEPTPFDQHFVSHIDFKAEDLGVADRAKLAAHAIYSQEARKRLRRLIAEFRPDVAHVRNVYHHLSPSIFWELKAQRVPVVYHLNDFKLICPSYNLVSKGRPCERCKGGKFWHVLPEGCYAGGTASASVLAAEAYIHRWLGTYQKCVDCFLAPSQFVKDKLVEHGWPAGRIEVLSHFQRVPKTLPSTPGPGAAALYFGRLSPEKGVDDLLYAMRLLPNVRLEIAGDGPQRSELERLAATLGLANVEFLGHLAGAELDARVAHSSFTVFPSRAYETLGKSILESYARGRTVVASDLGSRRELVRPEETGLLFPPGNIQRLADAISSLASDPVSSFAMGRRAQKWVAERFSPEGHYLALEELYTRLGHERGVPSVAPTKDNLQIAFIGGRGVVSKYSGIESYYEEVGKRLAEMGHQVTVYCRSYFTPALPQHNGMRIVRLPTVRTKHLETFIHTLLSTVHVAFSRCDIVHYHTLGPALFSFVPRLFGKKTVVTVQGLDWQRKKWGKFAAAVLRWGETASAHLPNATMVVTQTLQQHYQRRYRNVPHYVPNGTIIQKRRRPSHMVKWGIEPGKYLLFLGRFSPEKNCHLLIEAYQQLRTDVKLVLAGGSSYSDSYAAELRRRQSDKIRLLDWVAGTDLEELLTNAMVFVLPSDLEGLSLALLDAMGAGVCVLTSDVPENREVVEGAGFTFQHGDVSDLARMLELLISTPSLRQAAAESAQQRVRERYLWNDVATQVDLTYRELTAVNIRRPRIPPAPPTPMQGQDRGRPAA